MHLIVFFSDNAFQRGDRLFTCNFIPLCNIGTYFNDNTGYENVIDYFVTNDKCIVRNFEVLDPDINYSDHRPIAIKCICLTGKSGHVVDRSSHEDKMTITQLCWDHADLSLYYSITGVNLQPVLDDIIQLELSCSITPVIIDDIYSRVLDILHLASDTAVPKCSKNFFYKFWWDEELDILKEDSIKSCRIWKAVGRP